jgi:hypothetical protein
MPSDLRCGSHRGGDRSRARCGGRSRQHQRHLRDRRRRSGHHRTCQHLGNGVSGGTVNGLIGPVKVTDQRGLLVAAWTATVSSTSFTTGGGTPAETIPAADATYTPGLQTAVTGLPVPVPGLPGPLSSTPRAAFAATAVGSNSVTWNPNLSIAIPAAAVIGTYTGTVTHSVA